MIQLAPRHPESFPLDAGLPRTWQASIEVSYDRTAHHGTFVNLGGKATFQAVNVDGRYFFATRGRVQPHVLFGGNTPWFTVKDGSFLEPRRGRRRVLTGTA